MIKFNYKNLIFPDFYYDLDSFNNKDRRLKYFNIYINLIEKFISDWDKNNLESSSEIHHILPKCLGGENCRENLVKLPIRYHIMAHILLLEVYPDNYGIAQAVHLMTNPDFSLDYHSKRYNILLKNFSSKTISLVRIHSLEIINAYKRTEEYRQKISLGKNPNAKKVVSPEGKIYSSIREAQLESGVGKTAFYNWLNKGISSNPGWHYLEKKIPMKNYKKPNKTVSQMSRIVIGPDGTRYNSIKSASVYAKVSVSTLRKWMREESKDSHGWRYENELFRKSERLTQYRVSLKGGRNPSAKKVISPEGKIYNSIKDVCLELKINRYTINKLLNDKTSGWKIYDLNTKLNE